MYSEMKKTGLIIGRVKAMSDHSKELMHNKFALVTMSNGNTVLVTSSGHPNFDSKRHSWENTVIQLKKRVHTITTDNGTEFAKHKKIAKNLNAQFYFAHPYSSWERGLNENTNGLLRQYFPKLTDLGKIDQMRMSEAILKLNNRPRKSFGYLTPIENCTYASGEGQ